MHDKSLIANIAQKLMCKILWNFILNYALTHVVVYKGHSIKTVKKKLRSIFTIKKINHSFSKYLSLDDMQWSHCSSPLFKTTGEDCLEAVQRTQHCWNNFEIFIKFSAAELLLQRRKQPEIKWCEVWNIKAMLCDFNVAFTKMLLRINDM